MTRRVFFQQLSGLLVAAGLVLKKPKAPAPEEVHTRFEVREDLDGYASAKYLTARPPALRQDVRVVHEGHVLFEGRITAWGTAGNGVYWVEAVDPVTFQQKMSYDRWVRS